jgi:hypothetical protein
MIKVLRKKSTTTKVDTERHLTLIVTTSLKFSSIRVGSTIFPSDAWFMTLRRCTQSYSSQTSFWQKKIEFGHYCAGTALSSTSTRRPWWSCRSQSSCWWTSIIYPPAFQQGQGLRNRDHHRSSPLGAHECAAADGRSWGGAEGTSRYGTCHIYPLGISIGDRFHHLLVSRANGVVIGLRP